MDLRNLDFIHMVDEAERIQKPDHHADHDHDIQDIFDFTIHRNVSVDQPQQNANDDQSNDERYEGHDIFERAEAGSPLPASRPTGLLFNRYVVLNVLGTLDALDQVSRAALLGACVHKTA